MRMMNETKNGSSRAAVLRPRAPPLGQKKAPYKNDF